MKYEKIGFYDAVRLLGNKVGFNLDIKKGTKAKEKDEDLEIYELACKFYQNSITTSMGKNAIEYLDNRKIDKETIKKFRIGLSISKMSLTDYLISKKISLDKLIRLGISNESGTDLFVNRIMFPLYDLQGNVVAFSGRIYNTKDSSKYINTKETNIFKKGNLLYNYHQARELLRKSDSIIVMEGFMDVIRASTIGVNNCVATMGTAFTKQHAELLKKTTNNIILMFDGDEAGEEATTSAIEVLKEFDITPKVVRLPEDLDPDEYVLKYGKDSFVNVLNNPISSIDFLMQIHKNNKNMSDIADITKYINESLKDLASCDDEILISLTLKKLEAEYKIDYKTLEDKLKSLKSVKPKKDEIVAEKIKLNKYDMASRNLLYYMLKDEKVVNKVENEIAYIPDDNMRALLNEIIAYSHKFGIINIADFISYIAAKEDIFKTFNEIIKMNLKDKYLEEEIDDYIKVINSYPVKKKENELDKLLKAESDPLKQAEILKEKLALKGVKE